MLAIAFDKLRACTAGAEYACFVIRVQCTSGDLFR